MRLAFLLSAAAVVLALVSGLAGRPAGTKPKTSTQPIGVELSTIQDIVAYAQDPTNQVKTVEDFMDRLDPVLRRCYVLMEHSRSTQQASTPFPRIILFRPDGKLMIAIATDRSSDETYNDVEMLESTDGYEWRLGALHLDGQGGAPTLHFGRPKTGGFCTDCHGPSNRPIWGSYPDWTGAYANGSGHHLTKDQAAALTAILDPDRPQQNPRVAKLTFSKRTWAENDSFILPDQPRRGLANEFFNDALGARHVPSLWKVAKAADRSDLFLAGHVFRRPGGLALDGALQQQLLDRIAREWRQRGMDLKYPQAYERDQPLLLLGLDGFNDLALSERLIDYDPTARMNQKDISSKWNYIATYLGDLLTFRYLNELADNDPGFRQHFIDTPYSAATLSSLGHQYQNLDEYRLDEATYMWKLSLTDKLQFLQTRAPPTVDLRYERMFPDAWQQRARGDLEALVRKALQNNP
ncbi:MAG: hypothetical protein JO112_18405 [Planctomycetes bacterium]|nr:hypothetical protein [Planctomycetota bacterium]